MPKLQHRHLCGLLPRNAVEGPIGVFSCCLSYARKRGWTVAVEVKDVGYSATARPLREKLIETARRREIDSVPCGAWIAGDGRSRIVQELTALDVGFVSLSEALDLTTPSGRALAGMLAVFADNANGIFCGTG
jgi:DNA invertase Pin-like site-specific DNA recombinase